MKKKFNELDVIKLNKALENFPKGGRILDSDVVTAGTKGTIVVVYDNGHNYEIELFDQEGRSFGIFTVDQEDIDFWKFE